MTKKYIIYHDKCVDGLMSASVFKHYIESKLYNDKHNFTFIPGCYSNTYSDYPDMTDGIVYFLDFCFKRECFVQLLEVAQRVIVIDHHITAVKMLKEFKDHNKIYTKLDMNHCGCVLTYTYLYPDPKEHSKDTVNVLEAIEDVDIWLHRRKESKYLHLALTQNLSLDLIYEVYVNTINDPIANDVLYSAGAQIHFQFKKLAEEERKQSFVREIGCFGQVRFINSSIKGTQSIHCMHYLDSGMEDILIFFKYTEEGLACSIRSNGKVDCTQLAKFISTNGGGHVKASGALISNQYPLHIMAHPLIRIINDPNYIIRISRKQ